MSTSWVDKIDPLKMIYITLDCGPLYCLVIQTSKICADRFHCCVYRMYWDRIIGINLMVNEALQWKTCNTFVFYVELRYFDKQLLLPLYCAHEREVSSYNHLLFLINTFVDLWCLPYLFWFLWNKIILCWGQSV